MNLIVAFVLNIIILLLTYLICKSYFLVLVLSIPISLFAYNFVYEQLNFKIENKLLKLLYILLCETSICLSLFLTCDYLTLSNGRYILPFFFTILFINIALVTITKLYSNFNCIEDKNETLKISFEIIILIITKVIISMAISDKIASLILFSNLPAAYIINLLITFLLTFILYRMKHRKKDSNKLLFFC